MKRFQTIAIVNDKGEPKLIRKDDFDAEKHEKYEEPKGSKKQQKEEEPEKDHTFGNFKAQETDTAGWWNVVNTETQEKQSEKNLREDDAIALAKKLDAE